MRLHCCYICGKEEDWGPTWECYGSLRDIEDGFPVLDVCSKACREKLDALNPSVVLDTVQEGLRRPWY